MIEPARADVYLNITVAVRNVILGKVEKIPILAFFQFQQCYPPYFNHGINAGGMMRGKRCRRAGPQARS